MENSSCDERASDERVAPNGWGTARRAAPPAVVLALGLGLAACGGEPGFLASLVPDMSGETVAEGPPAVYPDPEADSYGRNAYGNSTAAQYDNGDEIVDGKCLPDHPVNYCTTIDGLFKQPIGQPVYKAREKFLDGNRVFNANWVPAPQAVNNLRDGLGPVFDAVSCAACHAKNGRGRPPAGPGETPETMIVRVSLAGAGPDGAPGPHPEFKDQINMRALAGAAPEARVDVSYETIEGAFADGRTYALRRPRVTVSGAAGAPLGSDVLISPRIAPQVIGLGLLEAVPDADLLARADPDDADGDGISGRANYRPDPAGGPARLGRYGWKAGAVSLRQQSVSALAGDMGITSNDVPVANCPTQHARCLGADDGGAPEISEPDLEALVFYMQMLRPTDRRGVGDPRVVRGEALFEVAGCAACHTTQMKTTQYPSVPALSGLVFHPYSDFLLHDMGEGLADGRPEFLANGREWRTPPLWGLGLTRQINGNTFYLHDGRARDLMEAILWHGGEAAAARQAVMTMPRAERAALIRFLESL